MRHGQGTPSPCCLPGEVGLSGCRTGRTGSVGLRTLHTWHASLAAPAHWALCTLGRPAWQHPPTGHSAHLAGQPGSTRPLGTLHPLGTHGVPTHGALPSTQQPNLQMHAWHASLAAPTLTVLSLPDPAHCFCACPACLPARSQQLCRTGTRTTAQRPTSRTMTSRTGTRISLWTRRKSVRPAVPARNKARMRAAEGRRLRGPVVR